MNVPKLQELAKRRAELQSVRADLNASEVYAQWEKDGHPLVSWVSDQRLKDLFASINSVEWEIEDLETAIIAEVCGSENSRPQSS